MNAPHAVPLQVDPDHPWPGLASYDESSQEFFNGRASEIDELVRRVLDEPMTVLFGKSGLGKSSLLMAGLFPKLRSHDLLPVYVRLQFRPNEPALIDQVKKAVVDELELHQVEHPPFRDSESLWEYLHRSGLELWSAMNRLVRPVLVFDQFEEVFTLGQTVPREVERFRRELADLAENRLPPAVAERLEKAAAINSSLDIQAMNYKIVVSLREDFLADLEGWRAAMPSLRRNRMRLLPMGPKQATAAILNDRTKHLVEPNQARRIVAFLSSGVSTGDSTTTGDAESGLVADGTVEPALLSLFCRGVNEQRIREGKKHFDDALLERGKEGIVADFYRDALADQLPATRKFIEEQLITEHGFRNSYSVVDARQHGYLPPKALDDLVDRRLLRREHYHGTERVELTHDLLTRAVLEDRDRRRQAERSEIERRRRLKTNRIRATSGGVAAVCLAFAAWALYQKDQADKATDEAKAQRSNSESREIAARAQTIIERDPRLAIRLALEGLRRNDSPEVRSALLEAARFAWPTVSIPSKSELGGPAVAISMRPDGRQLAIAHENGAVSLWDVTRRGTTRAPDNDGLGGAFSAQPDDEVAVLAFSPDGSRLAVGSRRGVRLIDFATKHADVRPTLAPVEALAFSPDGRTLAYSVYHSVYLWSKGAEPRVITVSGKYAGERTFNEIRFGVDGHSLVVVTADPLSFEHWKEQTDGTWKSQEGDLSKCVKPQSVSAGTLGATAAFSSFACLYTRTSKGVERELSIPAKDRLISDVVWSSSGSAYVEVLESAELIVRRPRSHGDPDPNAMPESRVKGWQSPSSREFNKMIAVSDDGRRLAAVEGNGRNVKVYTVGDSKMLLTQTEKEHVAVSPDGKWIAVARPIVEARESSMASKETPVRIVKLDDAFGDKRRAGPDYSIAGRVLNLIATPGSLLVVSQPDPKGALQITGVDYETGAAWTHPISRAPDNKNDLLGAAQSIVQIDTLRPSGEAFRPTFVRIRDGEIILRTQPDDAFVVSPTRTAILVYRERPDSGGRREGEVYSVEESRLVQRGTVRGLQASTHLSLSDDGMHVLEQDSDGKKALVWRPGQMGPAAGDIQPIWSATAHLDTGSRLSQWLGLLDAGRLWILRDTADGVRVELTRLGKSDQDAASLWTRALRSGESLERVAPLDRDRLLLTVSSKGTGRRVEIYRLDEKQRREGVYADVSPLGRYVVTESGSSEIEAKRFSVTRAGSSEALIEIPAAGRPLWKFSPDDRWLAVGEGGAEAGSVEFFDLASGRRVVGFDGPVEFGSIDFVGNNRVAKIRQERNDVVVLVPLDPLLVEKFARALVADQELTEDERCAYLPERGRCAEKTRQATVRRRTSEARN